MKKKQFIIDLGPLEYKVHVLYLYTEKEAQKYSNQHLGGTELEFSTNSVGEMFPIDQATSLIFFPFHLKKGNSYDLSTIVHEVGHCILGAFRNLTVTAHTDENEEFYCYAWSYLFRKIFEKLFMKE